MNSHAWLEKAACRGSDVNLFFPEVGVSYHQTDFIRYTCGQCPVQSECLELGLESGNDEYGFFGGKSPKDRQAIRAQRARASRTLVSTPMRIPNNESAKALDMDQQTQTDLA
jgi:hypothetical protein